MYYEYFSVIERSLFVDQFFLLHEMLYDLFAAKLLGPDKMVIEGLIGYLIYHPHGVDLDNDVAFGIYLSYAFCNE